MIKCSLCLVLKVPIPRSKSFMTVPQNYTIAELFEELQVNLVVLKKQNITLKMPPNMAINSRKRLGVR